MKYRLHNKGNKLYCVCRCAQVYLGKVRWGHGKGHDGLHWQLLLGVEGKLGIVVRTIQSSSLVGLKLLILESLVSKANRLIAIKVGLSIVSTIEAIIAVSIVITGPITVRYPVLCLVTEDFLWSVVVTAIAAATVLAVVKVPSASRETIPAIISIPATSTAP